MNPFKHGRKGGLDMLHTSQQCCCAATPTGILTALAVQSCPTCCQTLSHVYVCGCYLQAYSFRGCTSCGRCLCGSASVCRSGAQHLAVSASPKAPAGTALKLLWWLLCCLWVVHAVMVGPRREGVQHSVVGCCLSDGRSLVSLSCWLIPAGKQVCIGM
jgi:hypothetical protein